ncbi:MAG: hypothetical protein J4N66_08225, partial [Chloroflexi bacterium]|nr:hypothetical protein [Chloroflexota bacterium]
MFINGKLKLLIGLLVGGVIVVATACGGADEAAAPVIIRETVIVEVEVKGDEVIVERTVIVTEKGDTVEVVVTATPVAMAPEVVADLIKAPDTQTPAGTAVIAVGGTTLGSENGRGASQCCEGMKNTGIGETLYRRAPDDSTLNWLATDFTIASDLSSATVTIVSGVPFQVVDGYDAGMMTAADVAWTMNDANGVTNPESIHGQAGDFAGLWGEWVAVDDTTIKFDFNAYDSTWKDDYVNQSGQAFVVLSKKAFDEKGADWVADHVVATGPYQIEEWLRDESYTIVNRAGTHWLAELEPKTERIQIVQVSEPTTRLSLLRNGQVDMAHLEPKDAAKLDLTEFTQTSAGGAVQL